MKTFKTFLVLAFLAILAGCITNPQPPEPPQTRNVFVEPSAALLVDCEVSAPPEKKAFLQATDMERQQMLVKSNIATYGDLAKCNKRWAFVRNWYAEQRAIHTKDNPK